jgi:hypothetical protein
MEQKDKGFHFVYIANEDIKRENEKIVSELKDKQKQILFLMERIYTNSVVAIHTDSDSSLSI